ncbi:MAG: hypothetical protein J3K34DRAFT_519505 [Monoraphidium minutum]|nr:MAG: hypothetical protein J3K34DRAFT_519505 [Monoraphidium minutum]
MRAPVAVAVLLCALLARPAVAYPSLFANKISDGCQDQPAKALGAHGAPVPDKTTTFAFTDGGGAPVLAFCPGGTYNVSVKYASKVLALITASTGVMGSDKRCLNRVYSGDKSLFDGFDTKISVPCDAAGQPLSLRSTSASGPKDNYHQASAVVPVGFTDGDCEDIAKKAKCPPVLDPAAAANATAAAENATKALPGAGGPIISFMPIATLPAAAVMASGAAAADEDALMGVNRALGDDMLLRPVIASASAPRGLWVYLHAALMLAAFALLMPLGLLLARHRWMFGRDPRTGKVIGSWAVVHGFVQLLAVLCGVAGVIVAILGCGWKKVVSTPLYEPHKWLGVATLGAALLQLAAAALRPALGGAAAGGAWSVVHRVWGRVVAAAGVANVFIGTVLIHDYKGEPYVNWLAPAAAVLGALLLLAALLEAAKAQMQRTHRYNPETNEMCDVAEAYYKSGKRGGGGGGGGGAPRGGGGAFDVTAAAPSAGGAPRPEGSRV